MLDSLSGNDKRHGFITRLRYYLSYEEIKRLELSFDIINCVFEPLLDHRSFFQLNSSELKSLSDQIQSTKYYLDNPIEAKIADSILYLYMRWATVDWYRNETEIIREINKLKPIIPLTPPSKPKPAAWPFLNDSRQVPIWQYRTVEKITPKKSHKQIYKLPMAKKKKGVRNSLKIVFYEKQDPIILSPEERIYQEICVRAPSMRNLVNYAKAISKPKKGEKERLIVQKQDSPEAFKRLIDIYLNPALRIALNTAIKYGTDLEETISTALEELTLLLHDYHDDVRNLGWLQNKLKQAVTRKIVSDLFPFPSDSHNEQLRIIAFREYLDNHNVETDQPYLLSKENLQDLGSIAGKNGQIADTLESLYYQSTESINAYISRCELARRLHITEFDLEKYYGFQTANTKQELLLEKYTHISFCNFIEDQSFEQIDEEYNIDAIYAFNRLMPKEKNILIHRFGLNGRVPLTLEEVGQIHHITRERVRQIESKAIQSFKAYYRKRKTVHRNTEEISLSTDSYYKAVEATNAYFDSHPETEKKGKKLRKPVKTAPKKNVFMQTYNHGQKQIITIESTTASKKPELSDKFLSKLIEDWLDKHDGPYSLNEIILHNLILKTISKTRLYTIMLRLINNGTIERSILTSSDRTVLFVYWHKR